MRVLIADDESISRRLIEAKLRSAGYEPVVARDGAEARAILERDGSPRLALLDWEMPEFDGIDLCRWLRRRDQTPYTYVILLTARSGVENLAVGLDAGADDFIVKPFHGEELSARIRAGQRILAVHAELERTRDALREQATRDALTGLYNRRAILSRAEIELARIPRTGEPVTLVIADVDHFKRVNDTHGHPAGDAVLVETGRRFCALLRETDAVGRYGGEEFLFVLAGCARSSAPEVVDRLRIGTRIEPVDVGGARLCVTASFGVVTADEAIALPLSQLIDAADGALYRAKRAGRDRIVCVAPGDGAPGLACLATAGTS